MKTNIAYAVHSSDFLIDGMASPMCRFNSLEEAKSEYKNSPFAAFIVKELSCKREDGSLLITTEFMVVAPSLWIPIKYLPEYDGEYLCHIVRKNEGGTFSKYQRIRPLDKCEFAQSEDEKITHWMSIPSPEIPELITF